MAEIDVIVNNIVGNILTSSRNLLAVAFVLPFMRMFTTGSDISVEVGYVQFCT